jgi:uncharacterized damage-inducible protein DinB
LEDSLSFNPGIHPGLKKEENMSIGTSLAEELEQEAKATLKILERIPAEKFDWKPHEKSFSMGQLASHVADTVSWSIPTLNQEEMDFPSDYQPWIAKSTKELVDHFDDSVNQTVEILKNYPDDELMKTWKLTREGETMFSMPRIVIMRSFVINHLVHHRGQLSVYIRLNDIPVPSIYGPSADEENP